VCAWRRRWPGRPRRASASAGRLPPCRRHHPCPARSRAPARARRPPRHRESPACPYTRIRNTATAKCRQESRGTRHRRQSSHRPAPAMADRQRRHRKAPGVAVRPPHHRSAPGVAVRPPHHRPSVAGRPPHHRKALGVAVRPPRHPSPPGVAVLRAGVRRTAAPRATRHTDPSDRRPSHRPRPMHYRPPTVEGKGETDERNRARLGDGAHHGLCPPRATSPSRGALASRTLRRWPRPSRTSLVPDAGHDVKDRPGGRPANRPPAIVTVTVGHRDGSRAVLS